LFSSPIIEKYLFGILTLTFRFVLKLKIQLNVATFVALLIGENDW